MENSSRSPESATWRIVTLFALALAGFGINLLLLVRRLSDEAATLAGCGAGSGCETVLGSRWSQVFGVPVTVPGLLVYVAIMIGLTRPGRVLLAPLLGLVCGAAVWFIFVQAVVIRAFCPWCMAAHVVGLALTAIALPWLVRDSGTRRVLGRAAGAAVVGMVLVALIQVFGPRPATHRVGEIAAGDGAGASALVEDAHSRGDGRLVRFLDGRKGFRVAELPHHGNPEATHVIVDYFDYACGACRTMSGYLDALVAAHPDDICVILLPVPLDRACNHIMPEQDPGVPGACDMARAALAIWRTAPEHFLVFHQAVLADPTADTALALAAGLLPDAPTAMADPWIDAILLANISDWRTLSTESARLPKVLFANRRVMHGLPDSGETLMETFRDEFQLNR